MPPKITHPINYVKRAVRKNPKVEHAFLKRGGQSIKNITGENTAFSTTFNIKKIKSYLHRTKNKPILHVHTHPKINGLALTPSVLDLLNLHVSNVIYVTDKKKIPGQVHFKIKKGKEKSYEILREKISDTNTKLKEVTETMRKTPLVEQFKQDILEATVINELLKKPSGKEFLLRQKTIIPTNNYSYDLFNFCTQNKILHPQEIINYLRYGHLWESSTKRIKIYELLDIKFRFVPNANEGYRFDSENIDFIKER